MAVFGISLHEYLPSGNPKAVVATVNLGAGISLLHQQKDGGRQGDY